MKNFSLRTIVSSVVLSVLIFETVSCGYILYPERHGSRSGQIDPAVVIMDGLGLLLFIVPGVVAFAVDFTSGSVYLGGSRHTSSLSNQSHVIVVDQATIRDKTKLETVVSRETGQAVHLDAGNISVMRVTDPEHVRELVTFANEHIVNDSSQLFAQR